MTTTRSPFLSQSYGAYDHRDVPSEDAPLTHTGPGTPCGEYMRRFWQPVIFSDDLKDLPIPLKILGEELGRLPRQVRQRRPHGVALPSPWHVSGVRHPL